MERHLFEITGLYYKFELMKVHIEVFIEMEEVKVEFRQTFGNQNCEFQKGFQTLQEKQ